MEGFSRCRILDRILDRALDRALNRALAKILGWLVRLVVAERLTKVEIEVQLDEATSKVWNPFFSSEKL